MVASFLIDTRAKIVSLDLVILIGQKSSSRIRPCHIESPVNPFYLIISDSISLLYRLLTAGTVVDVCLPLPRLFELRHLQALSSRLPTHRKLVTYHSYRV